MLRRLCTVAMTVLFLVSIGACNEPETTITDQRETVTESTPTDSSPGEMVVE